MRCDSSAPMPAIGSSSSSRRGPRRERHRHLELALLAVGEVRREDVARSPSPTSSRTARAGSSRALARAPAPEAEAVARVRLHRERDVVERGEFRIDAGDLERARQALARALRRGQRGDVLAGEADRAGVGPQVAGELADEGGLAGAVRADDGVRLALGTSSVDAVGRAQRAEALGQAGDLKHRACRRCRRGRGGRRSPTGPAAARGSPASARSSPCSTSSTRSSAKAPSTGPAVLAMPPRITMNMRSPDCSQLIRLGRDVVGVVRVERAGEAAHRAGDDECGRGGRDRARSRWRASAPRSTSRRAAPCRSGS